MASTAVLPDHSVVTRPVPARPTGRLRGWARRALRGRVEDPGWARPALLALLAVTALLYLWDLSASGYANAFYSAAAQAGSQSWKALLFGSFDSSNFITVDKPPAALWVMGISARIFGVNAWSLLVPQALMGVATVGILYATVKRWFGPAAGLIAGAVCATTPVAVLMFRFNNPDALLVLLLTGGAYAMTRAVEDGRTRWLVLAGALVGTGFITKMLQALLVVPAFVLAYLIAAPHGVGSRLRALVAGGGALLVAALWWPVLASLVPAADRPYIGGSQDNSIWNLIFGYNGFGRLTGNESGSVGGGGAGPGGAGMWGPTGWTRLFNDEFGGQASWLIPAALVVLSGGVALTWRRGRTDRTRAALVLWGGWLLVTGLTFSFASGIIHPYYTVALAPAIGAVVGVGTVVLWRVRDGILGRLALAGALIATAVWSQQLLDRSPQWNSWLRVLVITAGVAVAGAIVVLPRVTGRLAVGIAGLALAAGIAGPLAYTLNTVHTPHSGSIPSAGPAVSQAGFGPGGGLGGQHAFGPRPGGGLGNGTQQFGGPQFGGPQFGGQGGAGSPGGSGGGSAGGLLDASTPGSSLVQALKAGASRYTWVAAATGSNTAAGYQLASGEPVMAIGGFNGTDPAPSLTQFQQYVAQGKIHYYISGGSGGRAGFGGLGGSGSSVASQIESWVTSHYSATTIDGVTVYDLTATGS
ncbi:MAG TPA: glycosyltransferase family 39 protein [Mycobacteriales bacterium]|nr:glycosyltransferase family 39 protein [Mycobacteriales bacterium]